jgi:hypothetical protein
LRESWGVHIGRARDITLHVMVAGLSFLRPAKNDFFGTS